MSGKPKLRFYDLKARKYFETDEYTVEEIETSRGRIRIAKAVSPYTGKVFTRILGRAK